MASQTPGSAVELAPASNLRSAGSSSAGSSSSSLSSDRFSASGASPKAPPERNTGDPFLDWFRHCTPYIHAHRGRTFVIAFGGEALDDARLPELVHDIALLHGLGIRLVLVHGARPQIERRLAERGTAFQYIDGLRVTDDAALTCVKEATGAARVEIEALLSFGLANSPMAGVRIPVASGNFVFARPIGVLNGVDYQHTGAVRRIDRVSLTQRLDQGAVALIPPIGYSPTGEVFNLTAADVARAVAIALEADKLIFLVEGDGLVDGPTAATPDESATQAHDPTTQARKIRSHLLGAEVAALLAQTQTQAQAQPHTQTLGEDLAQALRAGAEACEHGVARVHLVGRNDPSALLRELFTRDGAGTLMTGEPFERLRAAQSTDIPGIRRLLEPMERAGILVPRSAEELELVIDRFQVTEMDGTIIACASLLEFPHAQIGELACVAVHPAYRARGRGDRLLTHMEAQARAHGLERLFVLTTQTAHWFRERGFLPGSIEDLPEERRRQYNEARNSQIYIKPLLAQR
ncbi:amino-acid N-acetyltransferase [Halochromatium roseum]|uniref:amino-acid N-acetyltransferase n=1 Tax=Halochromatium roseum TaxID=391920 RepID=UPI0019140FCB|nr:amino-acid N-acetyltransferase [Halochromatium roseum]MBK5942132.1 amino-acid N-acetyltransferase [Halochromatium roseum]